MCSDRCSQKNRQYLYNGEYTAPADENDYESADNYLTEDGLAGFSLSQTGWLTSLYSNYMTGGFAHAIRKYIMESTHKLVCIVADTDEGNELVELYRKEYGFRKYAQTIDDTDLLRNVYGDRFIDDFLQHNGMPFHVFMIRGNVSAGTDEVRKFGYYFDAADYVDQSTKSDRKPDKN